LHFKCCQLASTEKKTERKRKRPWLHIVPEPSCGQEKTSFSVFFSFTLRAKFNEHIHGFFGQDDDLKVNVSMKNKNFRSRSKQGERQTRLEEVDFRVASSALIDEDPEASAHEGGSSLIGQLLPSSLFIFFFFVGFFVCAYEC